ncbi:MAG TPA: metal-sulfur cluster assembly factor [Acidimicrobiales bacterium]|nr:metal-sulfur cluster assembly factor [Acidimicrobiales bacterium]
MPTTDPLVEAAVLDGLSQVFDPELGLDVVSLGLVYGIGEEDGRVVVEMTLTTPGCPVSEMLPSEAAEAVACALGPLGRPSEVRVVWDPPWTPERLSDQAAAYLGFRRPGRSGEGESL